MIIQNALPYPRLSSGVPVVQPWAEEGSGLEDELKKDKFNIWRSIGFR